MSSYRFNQVKIFKSKSFSLTAAANIKHVQLIYPFLSILSFPEFKDKKNI